MRPPPATLNATTANRTKSTRKNKHPKPVDGFPLSVHPSGKWCKKHKGRSDYFGPLRDWKAALAKYEYGWSDIIDGCEVPAEDAEEHCTTADLCNAFLNSKRLKRCRSCTRA